MHPLLSPRFSFQRTGMNALQIPRPRRHPAVFVHPWDTVALEENSAAGLESARPNSALPVENLWLAQPASTGCASDVTQCESVSSSSSDESSPPSTRPPSWVESLCLIITRLLPSCVNVTTETVCRPQMVQFEVSWCAWAEKSAVHAGTLPTRSAWSGLVFFSRCRSVVHAMPKCLLTLLDSPLNKAGLLKVFIHTTQDLLIAVHPDVRIPRTYKRYSGLMGAYPVLPRVRRPLLTPDAVLLLLLQGERRAGAHAYSRRECPSPLPLAPSASRSRLRKPNPGSVATASHRTLPAAGHTSNSVKVASDGERELRFVCCAPLGALGRRAYGAGALGAGAAHVGLGAAHLRSSWVCARQGPPDGFCGRCH